MAALARALALRPDRDGAAFTDATELLCRMRDLLIRDGRAGLGVEPHLGRLNAVISSTLTGHFPLGKTDWSLLESSNNALQAIVTELRQHP